MLSISTPPPSTYKKTIKIMKIFEMDLNLDFLTIISSASELMIEDDLKSLTCSRNLKLNSYKLGDFVDQCYPKKTHFSKTSYKTNGPTDPFNPNKT
jgi:hypothetical protein